MLDYVVVWFIMKGAMGYRPPMEVRNPDCSFYGTIVGVQLDRDVNPREVMWPDPTRADYHCHIDIRSEVAGLPVGEYHVATTQMGKLAPAVGPVQPVIQHDPHTTGDWVRVAGGTEPPKPATFRVVKPGE